MLGGKLLNQAVELVLALESMERGAIRLCEFLSVMIQYYPDLL